MQLLAQPPMERRPSIRDMKERHFEMMRRLVAGDSAVDICRDMGMTQAWFSIVQASPVFQAELTKLRAEANAVATDVGSRVRALAPDAMSVLERAVRGIKKADGKVSPPEGITPALQTSLARDVLDRAGHGKPVAAAPAQVSVKVEVVQFAVATVPPDAKVVDSITIQGGIER